MSDACDDRLAIMDVLTTYALACDTRQWDLFDRVFTEDLVAEVGTQSSVGRQARVDGIRSNLGGCGPTQHLLGNFRIDVLGDEATCSTSVRALHIGAGERSHLTYEICATYHDRLRRTPEGWRIHHRRMEIPISMGTMEVLQPEPER
jgi:hypothetical protein